MTSPDETSPNHAPDAIEALLPWYAAGALSPDEQAQVEAALAARPDLRASLATIEDDRDEIVSLNEALGAPHGDVWARIAEGLQAAPRRRGWGERLAALWGSPAALRLATATAALVVLMQGAAMVALLRADGNVARFNVVTIAGGRADALVAFAPEAKMAEVGALLDQASVSVSGGPRAGGFYEIRLKVQPASRAQIEAAIRTLAGSPLVKTALPGGG